MNILVTNDDGIFARGIHLLTKGFGSFEDVNIYVCAPDRQRSCVGHGLTLFDDITLEDWPLDDFEGPVVWAKSCSGTPADCIRLALCVLGDSGVLIDMVCSGVNDGSNVGSDINYSGTIAACREATIEGIPAIGFSCARGLKYGENFMRIIPEIFGKFRGNIPPLTILTVNTTDLPWEELKGYRPARLAHITYPCRYTPLESEGGKQRFAFASFTLDVLSKEEDADRNLIDDGYIAVSFIPLLQDAGSTMRDVEKLL